MTRTKRPTSRSTLSAFCGLLVFAALATPATALEQRAFAMEILVDGAPLSEYAARGTSYVEAAEGREYGIRLTNHTSRRVAVALSVDGLNTIDAKNTSAKEASKWILDPWETVVLDGWQTAGNKARSFFFTTEERSYGAWLGEAVNLGVISAAVFRERARERAPIARPQTRREGELGRSGERQEKSRSSGPFSIGAEAPEQSGPPPTADGDLAATGIGREFTHRVRRVRFDAESEPATVLELRYEYHDALVSLGVLPASRPSWRERLERRERARGFEREEFSPDPFRRD